MFDQYMQTSSIPRPAVAVPFLLCGALACSDRDPGTPLVVQRDSAGVQIVEALRPLWGDSSLWRIDPDPVVDLTLSGTGPAHEFYQSRSMKQRPDGSLMIADGSSREVRVFSATGEFLASFGGRGDGPGEFRSLRGVENAGDTVVAFGRTRVTVAAPDLSVIRTFGVDFFTADLHYLSGGAMLRETSRPVMPMDGLTGSVRRMEPLVLVDLEGALVDSIGEMRGPELFALARDGSFVGGAGLWFGNRSHLDVLGQRILRGASDMMQLQELDMSGGLVRILRIPDYPLDLTAAERSHVLDRFPPGSTSVLKTVLEAVPASETRPAYADILVDPSGAIWLELYRGESERDQPQEWLVLDADGTWLGTVGIPDGFSVSDITMDAVLGIWRDELRVEHPQVLRLTRG